jgi:predicted lipoprotein with Yx(FWY)xxD motif
MKRGIFASVAICAVIALIAAGCGGTSKPKASTVSNAISPATIKVQSTKLGDVLADAQGRTLYLFEKDTSATSTCTGGCVAAWPPEITRGTPKAEAGASAAMLAEHSRSGGLTQVVYNGHPLYRYSGDTKAGETAGQGLKQFGAEWYVVSPSGSKVETKGGTS